MSALAAYSLVLMDAVDQIRTFVDTFVLVYILVIFVYIITSWVRLPYSPWLNRIQRFLYDVSEPYLRLFRRIAENWIARLINHVSELVIKMQ